jgi:tRNA-modifying protein YgfZ
MGHRCMFIAPLAGSRANPHVAHMVQVAALSDRGVIAVTGEDRVSFLQGLVSNDVADAAPGRAVWSALLTPQGKWLADFFILSDGERLLLDCERGQMGMLVTRLSRFRLRAKVAVAATDKLVFIAWNGVPEITALAAPDPRLEDAGWRILSDAPIPTNATAEDWDRHRLALGLPEGSRDLEAEKTVLLEAGFDELGGISWTKGCYMGQELTARTRYRGLLKRRLVPVSIDGPPPAPGTPVFRAGADVGTMRSSRDGTGLAALRLEALSAASLDCGEATLAPRIPDWMRLPERVG